MLRLLTVATSRSEWGLLSPVLQKLNSDSYFDSRLAITGQLQALQPSVARAEIASDGIRVDAEVSMELDGDTSAAATRALGRAVASFAGVLEEQKPDLLMVLGDRYEILAPVQAALLARVPVAHLCGGDETEGALDNQTRHAVSKLSHLHFATTELAASRLRQMGEDGARVFCVGSTGIDRIRSTAILRRDEFFRQIELDPLERNAIIAYHPETLSTDPVSDCTELLAALAEIAPRTGLLFTGTNDDPLGRTLGEMIAKFVAGRPHAKLHETLGSQLYFSALTHMDMIIGNSSSGIYEAPSFRIPTVNIGDRQKGRLQATTIINCRATRADISRAIHSAKSQDCSAAINPYGDGRSSDRIVAILKQVEAHGLLKKRFASEARAVSSAASGTR